MRTKPVIDCVVPVQCCVWESVSLSLLDQTLKYGSCTTSGMAGGRNAGGAASAEPASTAARRDTRRSESI